VASSEGQSFVGAFELQLLLDGKSLCIDMVGAQKQSRYQGDVIPVLVALGATLLVTLVFLLVAQRRRKQLPPGPLPWPILGNLPVLTGGMPHHLLRTLGEKYGGLMYLQLGSVPTIVVNSVDVSKELFQTRDTVFLDRPRMLVLDFLTDNYKNMAVSSGRYWRDLRKLVMTEIFTAKRLASYRNVRKEEIHNMMRELVKDSEQGRVVNLKDWLLGASFNSMTRMLINKRYYGDGLESQKEKEDYIDTMERTFREAFGPFIVSDFVPYLAFIDRWQG
jgi:cytochrome P450